MKKFIHTMGASLGKAWSSICKTCFPWTPLRYVVLRRCFENPWSLLRIADTIHTVKETRPLMIAILDVDGKSRMAISPVRHEFHFFMRIWHNCLIPKMEKSIQAGWRCEVSLPVAYCLGYRMLLLYTLPTFLLQHIVTFTGAREPLLIIQVLLDLKKQ